MKRKIAIALGSFALMLGANAAAAGMVGAAPADRVTICHGTASETNPYVEITVSANSFKNGHFDNNDYQDPSHGVNNNPDFVLQPGRTCADGPGGIG